MERTLPVDLNAESALLSAVLNSEQIDEIMSLKESDFYRNSHKMIFKAMKNMFRANKEIDIITLSNELKKNNLLDRVGGNSFIVELSDVVVSGSNYKEHLNIVQEKSKLRSLIVTCNNILNDAYQEKSKSLELINKLENELIPLTEEKDNQNNFQPISNQLITTYSYIESVKKDYNSIISNTGFDDLDYLMSGMQKGQLIVIAARPKMGKTMLALNIALNLAVTGRMVGFFSLEMEARELIIRLLSSMTSIPHRSITAGRIDNIEVQRIFSAGETLTRYPLFINPYPDQTYRSIERQIINFNRKYGKLQFIVIDYLGLMSDVKGETDKRKVITEITRQLKIIAKKYDLVVIALSQMNRKIEDRTSKIPTLADLRDSGSTEQDADKVIFIHRDCIYDKSKDPNVSKLYVAANRQGQTGDCLISFEPEYSRYGNIPIETAEQFNEKY